MNGRDTIRRDLVGRYGVLAVAGVVLLGLGILLLPGFLGPSTAELPAAKPAAAQRPCVIARVADGDSIECEDGLRVRLLGIDAPELAQPYGFEAKRMLAVLLPPESTVWLEVDREARDRHGRTLAYLWLDDGSFVNVAMVSLGYAVPLNYPPNDRYARELRSAADASRQAGRGLWATDAFECLPRGFRRGECGRERARPRPNRSSRLPSGQRS